MSADSRTGARLVNRRGRGDHERRSPHEFEAEHVTPTESAMGRLQMAHGRSRGSFEMFSSPASGFAPNTDSVHGHPCLNTATHGAHEPRPRRPFFPPGFMGTYAFPSPGAVPPLAPHHEGPPGDIADVP